MGILYIFVFAAIAFGIALYARSEPEPIVTVPMQPAAVALAPTPLSVSIEGTIVFDDAPAKNVQPFVLYGEPKADGTSTVKTKRLIFPSSYTCTAGDIPCVGMNPGEYPFIAGDQVRVEGVVEADVIYVRNLAILP